jgi:hypothetical protein
MKRISIHKYVYTSSRKAKSHWEMCRLLSNPKLHRYIHKSQILDPILSKIHPKKNNFTPYFVNIDYNILFPYAPRPSKCPLGIRAIILYAFLTSPMRILCPVYIILLHVIIEIIGQMCKLWISSLHSFLQSHDTSFLLDPESLLRNLLSNNFNLRSFLNARDPLTWTCGYFTAI